MSDTGNTIPGQQQVVKPLLPTGTIQVSTLFMDAFDSHSGSCRSSCECGRVHFDAAQQYDWEDGELEGLLKMAEQQPDRYIVHECGIGSYIVAGRHFVYGCQCQGGAAYEQFIIRHAHAIADYLNKRAKGMLDEAQATKVVMPDHPEK